MFDDTLQCSVACYNVQRQTTMIHDILPCYMTHCYIPWPCYNPWHVRYYHVPRHTIMLHDMLVVTTDAFFGVKKMKTKTSFFCFKLLTRCGIHEHACCRWNVRLNHWHRRQRGRRGNCQASGNPHGGKSRCRSEVHLRLWNWRLACFQSTLCTLQLFCWKAEK